MHYYDIGRSYAEEQYRNDNATDQAQSIAQSSACKTSPNAAICGFGFRADLEFKDSYKTFLVKCACCLKKQ